jgi:hypothetical protein
MSSLGVGYPFPLRQTMDNGSNTFTLAPYNIGGLAPSSLTGQIKIPSGSPTCPMPSEIDSNMTYSMCVALSRQCQADAELKANYRNYERYAPYAQQFSEFAGSPLSGSCANLLLQESQPQSQLQTFPQAGRTPNIYPNFHAVDHPHRKEQDQTIHAFRSMLTAYHNIR